MVTDATCQDFAITADGSTDFGSDLSSCSLSSPSLHELDASCSDSSVSDFKIDDQRCQRRCIFTAYWSNQNMVYNPLCRINSTKGGTVTISNNENSSPGAQRRAIFANRYHVSQLSDIEIVCSKTSRKESDTDLSCLSEPDEKPLKSCLRRSRFCTHQTGADRKRIPSFHHVRFSSEVAKQTYPIPMEFWSSENWSEYFAGSDRQ
jgi:hypothetical protein